jgi:hypothetical protein
MPRQRRVSAKASGLVGLYTSLRTEYKNTQVRVDDWLRLNGQKLAAVKDISQQTLAAASLAGAVAFNTPPPLGITFPTIDAKVMTQVQEAMKPEEAAIAVEITQEERATIIEKLQEVVKRPPGHMERQEELYLEQQLTDILGFEVAAELEGNRLNHTIGIMGGEQHLKRYPGDTLDQHDAYQESGIAPNRGAFGWFTEQGVMTDKARMREKYYFAVQTMYLPNWASEHSRLKPWYAFRKMIAINPAEKVAVVGVVGDAGPALWVKKQFGGSPEIIREGKIWSKASRGRVLLFFVNDPEDKIPLGPMSLEAAMELGESQ